jgi:hypothetical protein
MLTYDTDMEEYAYHKSAEALLKVINVFITLVRNLPVRVYFISLGMVTMKPHYSSKVRELKYSVF